MREVFFGGTFDPPHYGHLAPARAALAAGVTDRVLLVPAFAPPHKKGRAFASYEDRVRMLQLLIEGLPIEDPVAFSNAICKLMAE